MTEFIDGAERYPDLYGRPETPQPDERPSFTIVYDDEIEDIKPWMFEKPGMFQHWSDVAITLFALGYIMLLYKVLELLT